MGISSDDLWSMFEQALVGIYADARRQFVEKMFARDTKRARLEWLRARTFVTTAGGVSERKMASRCVRRARPQGPGDSRNDP
jgi:hypothetical protein